LSDKENFLQFQDLYNIIKYLAILVILGAAGPAFTASPTTTTATPSNYNFTNVPFDSQTAYFFLDYVDAVIASAFDSPNKTSFLNASSTRLSTIRKQHASNSSYLLITGFSRITFSPGYPSSHPTNKAFQPYISQNVLQPNTPAFTGFVPQLNSFPFTKCRFNASYNSDMPTLLDSYSVRRVALSGILTSGAILSTTRSLSDRDYVIYVVKDACLDSVDTTWLFETYFPMQTYVVSIEEAIGMMPNGTVDPRGPNGCNVVPM
jgi:nicotinamidase-related amidase